MLALLGKIFVYFLQIDKSLIVNFIQRCVYLNPKLNLRFAKIKGKYDIFNRGRLLFSIAAYTWIHFFVQLEDHIFYQTKLQGCLCSPGFTWQNIQEELTQDFKKSIEW